MQYCLIIITCFCNFVKGNEKGKDNMQEKHVLEIERKNKSVKLTEDEINEIIRRLQWHTGEAWKHFVLCYFISDQGRIYTAVKDEYITPQPNDKGYLYFRPSYHGKYGQKVYINRAVCMLFGDPEHAPNYDPVGAFLNTYGRYDAHHIDKEITHNTANNLIWIKQGIHDTMHKRLNSDLIQLKDIDTKDKARTYAAETEREKHYNDLLKQYGII